MIQYLKSLLTLKKLGLFVVSAMIFGLGFLATSHELSARVIDDQCGDDTECYSVPSGCGQGVGCIKKTCNDTRCPAPDGTITDCHWCDTMQVED